MEYLVKVPASEANGMCQNPSHGNSHDPYVVENARKRAMNRECARHAYDGCPACEPWIDFPDDEVMDMMFPECLIVDNRAADRDGQSEYHADDLHLI